MHFDQPDQDISQKTQPWVMNNIFFQEEKREKDNPSEGN